MEREVYDDFVSLLKEKTEKIKVGNPIERDVFLGPVVNEEAIEHVRAGSRRGEERERDHGRRADHRRRPRARPVRAADVVEAPDDSWLWKKELFVPFVAVAPFDELGDAIDKANDTEYGLTAGSSARTAEIEEWLDKIQAGVVYVNRRAGATTGAWPGVQPFGGWKGSGTTGKAGGGPYYVLQYLREQSRTVIEE